MLGKIPNVLGKIPFPIIPAVSQSSLPKHFGVSVDGKRDRATFNIWIHNIRDLHWTCSLSDSCLLRSMSLLKSMTWTTQLGRLGLLFWDVPARINSSVGDEPPRVCGGAVALIEYPTDTIP